MDDYRRRLGAALERAQKACSEESGILESQAISREDRELLTAAGWLQEIIRGWYMLVRPDVTPGDSTAWYAYFWSFVRLFLNHQYGTDYCLSAESSLSLHVGSTTIPQQVIVMVSKGGGKPQELPHQTSLFAYADPTNLPKQKAIVEGVQCMPLALALCRVGPRFFQTAPHEAQIALGLLDSVDDVTQAVMEHGLQRGVGRLIGAYEALGQYEFAQQLREMLKKLGLKRREENPFIAAPLPLSARHRSPVATRIEVLWQGYREQVRDIFPSESESIQDPSRYLESIEHLYTQDAYHSLSIEGYHVTPDLVERVQNHAWNPQSHPEDAQESNALAARGYYEAFQVVKQTIQQIIDGISAATQCENDLPAWYRSLWAPSQRAGIIDSVNGSGYRRGPVFIRGSRHVPPAAHVVLDAMEAFFDCLQAEESAAVRAVLGHYFFVFIHPYPDGNGRIARFLMNVMLASGGCPWTIVRLERRQVYMEALEKTNVDGDISTFAQFLVEEMEASQRLFPPGRK